jgi:murein DD-endopeptidase MepM/ murein hydrolase activator NlpD
MKVTQTSDYRIYIDDVRVDEYVFTWSTFLGLSLEEAGGSITFFKAPSLIDFKPYLAQVRIFVKNVFTNKYVMVFEGEITDCSYDDSRSNIGKITYGLQGYAHWLNFQLSMHIDSMTVLDAYQKFMYYAQGINPENVAGLFTTAEALRFQNLNLSEVIQELCKKVFSTTAQSENSAFYFSMISKNAERKSVYKKFKVLNDIDPLFRKAKFMDYFTLIKSNQVDTFLNYLYQVLSEVMFEFYQDRDGYLSIKNPGWSEPILKNHIIDESVVMTLTGQRAWSQEPTRVLAIGGRSALLERLPQQTTATNYFKLDFVPHVVYIGNGEANNGEVFESGDFQTLSGTGLSSDDLTVIDQNVINQPDFTETGWSGGWYFDLGTESITSPFTYPNPRTDSDTHGDTHMGTDFGFSKGDLIKNQGGKGKVVYASNHNDYGNTVVVQQQVNGATYYFLYAHLETITTNKDALLKSGEEIGKAGDTGMSNGPHLHFEVITSQKRRSKNMTENGKNFDIGKKGFPNYSAVYEPVNPVSYFNKWNAIVKKKMGITTSNVKTSSNSTNAQASFSEDIPKSSPNANTSGTGTSSNSSTNNFNANNNFPKSIPIRYNDITTPGRLKDASAKMKQSFSLSAPLIQYFEQYSFSGNSDPKTSQVDPVMLASVTDYFTASTFQEIDNTNTGHYGISGYPLLQMKSLIDKGTFSSYEALKNRPDTSIQVTSALLANYYSYFGRWTLALAAYYLGDDQVIKSAQTNRPSNLKNNYVELIPFIEDELRKSEQRLTKPNSDPAFEIARFRFDTFVKHVLNTFCDAYGGNYIDGDPHYAIQSSPTVELPNLLNPFESGYQLGTTTNATEVNDTSVTQNRLQLSIEEKQYKMVLKIAEKALIRYDMDGSLVANKSVTDNAQEQEAIVEIFDNQEDAVGIGQNNRDQIESLLNRFARYTMALFRGKAHMLNINTVVPLPFIRPGMNVWVEPSRFNKVSYVTGISHQGAYREGVITTLRTEYVRDSDSYDSVDAKIFLEDERKNVSSQFGTVISKGQMGAVISELSKLHNTDVDSDPAKEAYLFQTLQKYYGSNNANAQSSNWSGEYNENEIVSKIRAIYSAGDVPGVIVDRKKEIARAFRQAETFFMQKMFLNFTQF